MRHRIYPAARRRILEIWHYTDATWGEQQADRYVRDLHAAIASAADNRHLWRQVRHPELEGVYCIRYERHLIFFRELSDGSLAVVSVLHRQMNIPDRLIEDLAPDGN